MKHCHLDVLNFAWVCRGMGKAVKVVVVSYFGSGYQQPSGTGLSDRTSVELDPPLSHLGQAFLSVSRHRPPPIIFLSLFPLSLSLGYDGWPALAMGGRTEVCVCVQV